MADPDLLGRAIGNLLRNSLRYAPGSGPVSLSATTEGTRVFLKVADQGPGVPEQALSQLGEPFFRPDVARSREKGGVGLGLAIVRSCVEACRGKVGFANRQPQGFEATIELIRA
jgi:two-component system sensor histidine kinase CpxA